MPYQITHFDELALPVYNPQQDHSPPDGSVALIDALGGMFDRYVDLESKANAKPIVLTGLVWGETTYVVDEAGDYLVDEAGDFVIAGDDTAMLRSQIAALGEKVRKKGTLWRKRLDDNVREWKTARFRRMGQPQTVRDRAFMATVTCEFESAMVNWHAETPRTYTGAASEGSPATFTVSNPGEIAYDAIVTVACTSGELTLITFFNDSMGGVQWQWGFTRTVANGQTLLVDAGGQGVVGAEDGLAAYAYFYLVGSLAPGWMPIARGTQMIQILVEGGSADVSLEFYPQFA